MIHMRIKCEIPENKIRDTRGFDKKSKRILKEIPEVIIKDTRGYNERDRII